MTTRHFFGQRPIEKTVTSPLSANLRTSRTCIDRVFAFFFFFLSFLITKKSTTGLAHVDPNHSLAAFHKKLFYYFPPSRAPETWNPNEVLLQSRYLHPQHSVAKWIDSRGEFASMIGLSICDYFVIPQQLYHLWTLLFAKFETFEIKKHPLSFSLRCFWWRPDKNDKNDSPAAPLKGLVWEGGASVQLARHFRIIQQVLHWEDR